MKRATLDALVEGRKARQALVRLIWIESGEERILTDTSEVEDNEELATAVRNALRSDRASLLGTASGQVFVHPFNPSSSRDRGGSPYCPAPNALGFRSGLRSDNH